WTHSANLDGPLALDCAMDRHIGYIRPSLTEHVRSTAMDRHMEYIRPSLRWTMSSPIGYTRSCLTEHIHSTVTSASLANHMESHFVSTRPSLARDCDGLTHCMHSTKLDGTCALNFAACTTRLCALHWFQDIVNIYQ
ncbi:hypothetical protein AeMF1_020139, partial [Aphanomyces euteiches]